MSKIGIVSTGGAHTDVLNKLKASGMDVVLSFSDNAKVRNVVPGTEVVELENLSKFIDSPRVVILVGQEGVEGERCCQRVARTLEEGDTIIDMSNNYFDDDICRAADLREAGIDFLDIGTVNKRGLCLMVGGPREAFLDVEHIVAALADRGGYIYGGENGAGHYLKNLFDGIDHEITKAYARGAEQLRESPYGDTLSFPEFFIFTHKYIHETPCASAAEAFSEAVS